jgi:predicted metal-dependent hydrolase
MKELKKISPHLKLKMSKRAQRLALRLDNKRRVMHLVVPPRISLRHAFEFAEQHKGWIREKLAELPPVVAFEHGTVIPILGRKRRIRIHYDPALERTDITLEKNRLIVRTNQADPTLRIIRFLKETAREKISQLAHDKAASVDKKIKQIYLRDTTSRWGSCGPDGNLSFSWRLVFAPISALDYVVAHEVAHLVHMNHGPRFWAQCEDLSRSYTRGKEWMLREGHTLLRYS